MPIKMKPVNVIKTRLGFGPDGEAIKFLTSECAKAMDKFVPMVSGELASYRIEHNYIIYGDNSSNAYAKYQYYGIRKDGTHKINENNRDRSKHSLASSYWDKKMITADLPDIIKRVQEHYGGK